MNWKTKLGSRKFWALIAVFVTSVLVMFGLGTAEVERIVAMISAAGAVITYILVEGNIDAKSTESSFFIEDFPEEEDEEDIEE